MRSSLLLVILLALAGCDRPAPTAPASGQLLMGGKPLDNILVTLIPESSGETAPVRSMGVTDAQGRFQLRTETQIDGALIGAHRVILEDLSLLTAPRSADGTVIKMPQARFPDRYKSALQSPLKAEINLGANELTLEIR